MVGDGGGYGMRVDYCGLNVNFVVYCVVGKCFGVL